MSLNDQMKRLLWPRAAPKKISLGALAEAQGKIGKRGWVDKLGDIWAEKL
jgi:hypothetical protein